jgi:glycine/D-amino acid oxidase-like deaminating enzyme
VIVPLGVGVGVVGVGVADGVVEGDVVGVAAVCWTKSVITVFGGTVFPEAGTWFHTVPTGMFWLTGPLAYWTLGCEVNP